MNSTAFMSLINVPSFVDYFLLTEFAFSVDGYKFSSYFYKVSCRMSDGMSKGIRCSMYTLTKQSMEENEFGLTQFVP